MLKKILNNNYFEMIIYLISIIVIFTLINERINMEHFTTKINSNKNNKKIIYSIIPSAVEDNLYFASFFSNQKNKKKGDIDNLVYTRSLKSNNWNKIKNSQLNNNTLIIDLNYDDSKRLIAVGLSMKDNEPTYDIFIKENVDFESKWVKMDSNQKMRSICYDINTGKLIGINSYDGQIYENRIGGGGNYINWIGPINYDKPMKKILFNREGILVGIGLIDNYIYKKNDKNWRHSEYDEKNVNKTKVYDLFFDKDGCMIASTQNGVMKQLHQDFNSEFVDIRDYKEKHEDLMNNTEILKSRVGIEFIDDEFDVNTELGKDLKRLYDFKKVSKELCNNKVSLRKHSIEDSKIDILSKQNREINDLYNIIDEISGKMDY